MEPFELGGEDLIAVDFLVSLSDKFPMLLITDDLLRSRHN